MKNIAARSRVLGAKVEKVVFIDIDNPKRGKMKAGKPKIKAREAEEEGVLHFLVSHMVPFSTPVVVVKDAEEAKNAVLASLSSHIPLPASRASLVAGDASPRPEEKEKKEIIIVVKCEPSKSAKEKLKVSGFMNSKGVMLRLNNSGAEIKILGQEEVVQSLILGRVVTD